MRTEEGVIIEVIGDIAKIKAGKHSECKSCGACPGNDSAIVTAKNQIGAIIGQRVTFEVKESNALKGAFIVFALPLIVVFVGVMLGGSIGNTIGNNIFACKIIGGMIAFILVALFIKFFDNYIGKTEKSLPKVVSIIR